MRITSQSFANFSSIIRSGRQTATAACNNASGLKPSGAATFVPRRAARGAIQPKEPIGMSAAADVSHTCNH